MIKKMVEVSEPLMRSFCDFVTDLMGLYYPQEGWNELERKLQSMAKALKFNQVADCIKWIMQSTSYKEKIAILSHYLTTGETYFFRDPSLMRVLENKILPHLIEIHKTKDRQLRIWSAACCSGEEPYSIAILLRRMIPNFQEWNIKIIGSDINPRFLQKAEIAEYKEWSFRATPKEMRNSYFTKKAEGVYLLNADIKNMVKFVQLNLIENDYPSITNDFNQMDLILCNNVLIYFSPLQIKNVVRQLSDTLVERGYLVVSAIEVPYIHDVNLISTKYEETTVFKKDSRFTHTKLDELIAEPSHSIFTPLSYSSSKAPSPLPANITVELPAFINPSQSSLEFDFGQVSVPAKDQFKETTVKQKKKEHKKQEIVSYQHLLKQYQEGEYPKVIRVLEQLLVNQELNSEEFLLLAKSHLHIKNEQAALQYCKKALEKNKLNPHLYYIEAHILQEMNELTEASHALKRALYLDPKFVMAHFRLGNLMLEQQKPKEAFRHFRNVLDLLQHDQSHTSIPGEEMFSAQELKEIVQKLINKIQMK